MNRNLKEELDEKNIRKLFGEIRQHDDQIAPSFSAVLVRSSSAESPVRIGRLLPIVATIMILIFAGVIGMVYFKKTASPQIMIPSGNKREQIANVQPAPIAPEKPAEQTAPHRVVYRPRMKIIRRNDLLISQ